MSSPNGTACGPSRLRRSPSQLWLYPGLLGGDESEFSTQGQALPNVTAGTSPASSAKAAPHQTYLNGRLRARLPEDDMTPKGIIALRSPRHR
ncbi:MAG: hypothetical protein R3C02_01705 [Planctomycetaceae bacterium]